MQCNDLININNRDFENKILNKILYDNVFVGCVAYIKDCVGNKYCPLVLSDDKIQKIVEKYDEIRNNIKTFL